MYQIIINFDCIYFFYDASHESNAYKSSETYEII